MPIVTGLPIEAVLPELADALTASGTAVLIAPPGTGKTTVVPLALIGALGPDVGLGPGGAGPGGRVVVAAPRRLAARAAASRMAELLGERVGERVGYSVRGDSRTGPRTQVEVVTTGLLVQRMQHDPELPGVAALMLDECHERQLEVDLALAFAVDVRAGLRPDLPVLATSATLQADRIAQVLGGGVPAPVVSAQDVLHPVQHTWCPPPAGTRPAHGLWVDPRLLDHVALVVRRAVAETEGDVLVFLPGAGEIAAVQARLRDLAGVAVLPLHGRLPAEAQDAVLRPAPGRRRVVLATAVAESSLTVPGVRAVVDAGLSRVPRLDLSRGLGALVTTTASRASAAQRAGRAGREGPGRVYRCWPQAEDERRPAYPQPEVATADLTGFALQLACWGAPGGRGLALPDPPEGAALELATRTLHDLGALAADGTATGRGRALLAVGAHPRLARAVLDGAALVGARRAAEVVALLSEDVLAGQDLVALWRRLSRSGPGDPAAARWRAETGRLRRAVPGRGSETAGPARLSDDVCAATVVGLAYPERLARLRRAGGSTYLMASGTAAQLDQGSPLTGAPWLAVAVADRAPGRSNARIRCAVATDEGTAREVGLGLLAEDEEVTWAEGDVRAWRRQRLGAIVLDQQPLTSPDPGAVRAAVAEGLRREGLSLLRWTGAATALRQRMAAAHAGLGEPWPAVDDEDLMARLELGGAHSRADLRRVDLVQALRSMLPWQVAGSLDEAVPERVGVPSGSQVRVDYSEPAEPVLAVRLQELFGCRAAPVVAGRPVLVHLLSPAGRPVAVTRDLDSFWRNGYPAVRAELRGRYPKHPWPPDPLTAPATRRVSRPR